jgi:hypothetical protein
MEPLSGTMHTAYAELLEQLLTLDARRTIGHARGAFVTKEIKGRTYWYFQFSTPGGTTKQAYVGPRSRQLDDIVRRFERERDELREDRERIEELCAMLRAGATVTQAGPARVIGALADAGVFKLGGVLVGTHAFVVLGNVLGVRWKGAHARTEDIDIASERVLEVAVPELHADVPATLESLGMGFLPVPGFSPKEPSTSFSVRGRALRVDLVTPARSRRAAPVRIERFNAAAAPLSFVELLLEDAQAAAVIDGGGVLVRVPHPAHFAVHKILVATERAAAFHAKREKDLAQAAHVIEALEELRPGELRRIWARSRKRGRGWERGLREGAALLEARHPEAFARVKRFHGAR